MAVTRPTREDNARVQSRKRRFLVSYVLPCHLLLALHTTYLLAYAAIFVLPYTSILQCWTSSLYATASNAVSSRFSCSSQACLALHAFSRRGFSGAVCCCQTEADTAVSEYIVEDTDWKAEAVGGPGEEVSLQLMLRVVADVGIVGYPNAGKSSLLAAITRSASCSQALDRSTSGPDVFIWLCSRLFSKF